MNLVRRTVALHSGGEVDLKLVRDSETMLLNYCVAEQTKPRSLDSNNLNLDWINHQTSPQIEFKIYASRQCSAVEADSNLDFPVWHIVYLVSKLEINLKQVRRTRTQHRPLSTARQFRRFRTRADCRFPSVLQRQPCRSRNHTHQ